MHEMVKEFLDAHESAEREEYEEEKQQTLLELGLYEKEYSLYDGEFYKIIPIDVTDEEYETIKKYIQKDKPNNDQTNDYFKKENKMALILKRLGLGSIITGVIVSVVMINLGKIPAFFSSLACTLFLGIPILAFAEIIKLLEAIKNK